MISVLKRAHFRRLCQNPLFYDWLRGYSSVSSDVKIQIPKRIERSPTDILEALATTVQKDPTAAHYKFPDDPHFTVQSQFQKRMLALSKESGRKAAWWVVEEHKNLFQHKLADPPIEMFFPSKIYTKENSNINVLNELIDKREVSNAITVYKILKEENIDVDNSLKLKLLELCCFYNSEDHGDERLEEEKWYFKVEEDASTLKTWKSNGFAEELFLEFENDPKATCAVIQGRIKYCDVNAGYDLYTNATFKGIPLNSGVYNGLISVVESLKQSDDERWKLILDFFREMNQKRIPADIDTLNSALKALARMSRLVRTEDSVFPLLSEFKRLNVEPSLGSYYFILKHVYHRQRNQAYDLLNTILARIHGKEHKIRHPSDVYFFPLAMNLCLMTRNLSAAKLLNETLNVGQNYKLLSNDMHESRYFRDFLRLVFSEESIETAMETYQALVPLVYVPDFPTLTNITDIINKNGAVEYFPVIWQQVLNSEANNTKMYEAFLSAVISNPLTGDELKKFYIDVADKIYSTVENKSRQERSFMSWTSNMISGVLTLYVRAKDYKNAKVVLQTAGKLLNVEMDPNALNEFLNLCISVDKPAQAIECLQYAHQRGFSNSTEIAKRIRAEFLLDDKQRTFVSSILDS